MFVEVTVAGVGEGNSIASRCIVYLLLLLNTTMNLMTLFVLVLHVLRTVFGFIFLN